MRRMIATALFVGVVGVLAELLLLGHTESWQQWIAVVALIVGLAALVASVLRPGAATLRAFRWIMIAWIAVGVLGVYFHVAGNLEFELERQQSLTGLPLVWSTMTGATPILGPGALVLLALIGLAYLHKHPSVSERHGVGHD